MANALWYPRFKALDSNGDVLSGGKVHTYEAGTTTPKTSYSDSAQTTPNANPVILSALGEADIHLDGSYKILLTDSDDVTITGFPLDNIQGAGVDPIVFSVVAALANIATGTTDGEMRLLADSGNMYSWDDGGSKWRIVAGNWYATADLPIAATYTIETGTVVFDTTTLADKYWSGSAWLPCIDQELKEKFLL